MRRFTYNDDSSSKFWEISRQGNEVKVNFGRIGTHGQTQTKSFSNESEAEEHIAKLIGEKIKKGYIEEGNSSQVNHSTALNSASTTGSSWPTELPDSPPKARNPQPHIQAAKNEVKAPLAEVTTAQTELTTKTEATASSSSAPTTSSVPMTSAGPKTSAVPKTSSGVAPILSLESIVYELENQNHSAIPAYFNGLSEPKRSAFRKQYLASYSLYSTVSTFNGSLDEIRQDQMNMFPSKPKEFAGCSLLDLAVGNRQEVLYAIRPAMKYFPDESIQILKGRDADWLLPAIAKSLVTEPDDSFNVWGRLVENGMLNVVWDDRTVAMAMLSFETRSKLTIPRLVERVPEVAEIAYRMCEVENRVIGSPTSGCRPIMDFLDSLQQSGQLDRLRMLRSTLNGMYMVKNQNQIKNCQVLFEYLKPTLDELAEMQPDLCAVLDQGKPISFTLCLEQFEKLAAQNRLDWAIVSTSLGAMFARAGIGQSQSAIKLLRCALSTQETRDWGCLALIQALLHSNRQVAQEAWKTLLPVLSQASSDVSRALKEIHAVIQGAMRDILDAYLATENSVVSQSTPAGEPSLSEQDATDLTWESLLEQIQKVPSSIRDALGLKEAWQAARQSRLPEYISWDLMSAVVLPSCEKLEPIGSLDELMERLGRATVEEASLLDLELILDAICRFPGTSDPNFRVKTAALRKMLTGEIRLKVSRLWWMSDFMALIAAWLGEPQAEETNLSPTKRAIGQLRVAAARTWVAEGRSFELTSIPTHQGGWIDPVIWLDRLEKAQAEQSSLLLEDIELGLLRLAPDGRTTQLRNPQLVERSHKLQGPHAIMVQYAMGKPVSFEDMTGSKRLWLAAIRSRHPHWIIPDSVGFAKGLTDRDVLKPVEWNLQFENEIGDVLRPRGCKISSPNSDMAIQATYQPDPLELDPPFESSATRVDNVFVPRLLARYVLSRDVEFSLRMISIPNQIDWYWLKLLPGLLIQTKRKFQLEAQIAHSPWLETDRPLTRESCLALWLASLAKSEETGLAARQAWTKIIADERFNVTLLLETAKELVPMEWCVIKRWSEVLQAVAVESSLHAWELSRLCLGLLSTIEINATDAAGFVEIISQAHTRLGIALSADEQRVLARYASGKCKKVIQALQAIQSRDDDKRLQVAKNRLTVRLERAKRWSSIKPDGPLTEAASDWTDWLSGCKGEAVSPPDDAKQSSSTNQPTTEATSQVALIPTVKSEATKSRKAVAAKKKVQVEVDVPLIRSPELFRLLRASLLSLTSRPEFDYYLGFQESFESSVRGYRDIDDLYLQLLFHHWGLPIVKSPMEVAERLRSQSQEVLHQANQEYAAYANWLFVLATALSVGDEAWAKQLVDSLDINKRSSIDLTTENAATIAILATESLRSSPLQMPQSRLAVLEGDKKLSDFRETLTTIKAKDSAAFQKSFSSTAKKAMREMSKTMRSEGRNATWRLSSALLTILWHAAHKHGLDVAAVPASSMALVPTASTMNWDQRLSPLFPLRDNREEIALAQLGQLFSQARIKYAILKPKFEPERAWPFMTQWNIVIDSRDEQAWNRLFEIYDPTLFLLNTDWQSGSPEGYQTAFAAALAHGAIFRRLAIPDALLDKVLTSAEQHTIQGIQVSFACLEHAIALELPIYHDLVTASIGAARHKNQRYHGAKANAFCSWIASLVSSADRAIVWPEVQEVANELNVAAYVQRFQK